MLIQQPIYRGDKIFSKILLVREREIYLPKLKINLQLNLLS